MTAHMILQGCGGRWAVGSRGRGEQADVYTPMGMALLCDYGRHAPKNGKQIPVGIFFQDPQV